MPEALVYIPGRIPEPPGPLARFLPRLPAGVVSTWLQDNLPAGAWVLDPFGASPQLVAEAARAGYRVLVAANNPIAHFLIEVAANPPSREEMQLALAELAASRRGEERIEPHIRELYTTQCDKCGEMVEAQAFLWERDAAAPYARIYDCPACGQSGEYPVTPLDVEKAARFSSGGLHRARALARVAPVDDPNRQHAEEALEAYPPRAVYALFTLINKLDGLELPAARQRDLAALLLSACDRANTLWRYPSRRERPKQLGVPTHFMENNVWLALENAIAEWTAEGQAAVPLVEWPGQPPEGGICLFDGRLKKLVKHLPDARPGIEVGAVVTAFPRPNQAFWTLSALWAGWLWGQEAVGPFVSVLRRRRYDWAWHTTAVHANLEDLAPHIAEGTPLYGLVTESEPGFNLAVQTAAALSGFRLEDLALRPDAGQTQLLWHKRASVQANEEVAVEQTINLAAQEFLRQRGQPAEYLRMQAAAGRGLAHAHLLGNPGLSPADNFTELRNQIESFSFMHGFLRYKGSAERVPVKSPEVGQWWLRDAGEAEAPLADRVEKALVNHLVANPDTPFLELDAAVCRVFPSLLTPESDLLLATLASYAEMDARGNWEMRPDDAPKARRADLETVRAMLVELGERLGCKTSAGDPLLWIGADGQVDFAFYVIASAVLGEIVFEPQYPPERGCIVLPGGRANLVMHKIKNDPHLEQEIEKGWRFLKFRHVRRMAENLTITRTVFDEQLGLDPLTYTAPQIPLL
jgi:hypothetical protein